MKKILGVIAIVIILFILVRTFSSVTPTTQVPDEEVSVPLTAEEQQGVAEQKAAVSSSTQSGRYTHPVIGFSFEKPAGYTVGVVPGSDGSQTLIVQPKSGNLRQAFQIVISPTEQAIDLTPNLIKTELPGTSVSNAQKILLDSRGKGIMFASNNDAFGGKSYEIWFSTDTHLYQVTSYGEFGAQLQGIIGTWKF